MKTILSKEKMREIKGGVSAKEYCSTLRTIIQNNTLSDGAREGAGYGWVQGNCGKYYSDVVL